MIAPPAYEVRPKRPAILTRQSFETSRLLEFFTEKELRQQIGHAPTRWPIALLKELIDNALDGCEASGVMPSIEVDVEDDALTVVDNGPGIAATTVTRSLDYMVRVSDKAYYVSPTRGQLGNALKCVYASPFVVTGEAARVQIDAQGQRHDITVELDRLAQVPTIGCDTSSSDREIGTRIRVGWPEIAGCLAPSGDGDSYKSGIEDAVELVRGYAAFNPHARFRLHIGGRDIVLEPTRPDWRKWLPTDPTSAHWYTPEQLRDLVAAYVTSGTERTVREFIAEFRGLSATAKQRVILEQTGLSRAGLVHLVRGGDVDISLLTRLLALMQNNSREVKPDALGIVGEEHMTHHLVAHRDVESVRYRKVAGIHHGRPYAWEIAFGILGGAALEAGCHRNVVVGLNWTPAIQPPIRELTQLLGQQRVDSHDPVVLLVHLATPVLPFTDRGKSVLDLAGG